MSLAAGADSRAASSLLLDHEQRGVPEILSTSLAKLKPEKLFQNKNWLWVTDHTEENGSFVNESDRYLAFVDSVPCPSTSLIFSKSAEA